MNTEYPELTSHSIFPIKIGDSYMIYAPISDCCFICDDVDVNRMETALSIGTLTGSAYEEILHPLLDDARRHEFAEASHKGLTNISIFPTWSCNFNCTYCYASAMHIQGDLPNSVAFTALDYFFGLNDDPVYLQLLGGGEPFTKWETVKRVAAYARGLEKESGRHLTISIATNGSIITDSIIQDIKDYDIRISFSFDILEEIQNRQRGNYDLVKKNLKRLLNKGLGDRIMLRTVVTVNSVESLHRMVAEVIKEYPDVCGVIAEPVMGLDNFQSVEAYGDFCRDFYREFSSARKEALEKGLEFTTMILRNIDFTIDRSCEGDFCVTPEGRVTICHRLASPSESLAEDSPYVFGWIYPDRVVVDEERYLSLANHSVRDRKECNDCFAKYNCGGGCIARNVNETEVSKRYFCHLTRSLLLDELLRRYDTYE